MRFTATWCGPCKVFSSKWAKIIKEFPTVNYYTIDIDENPDLVKRFDIKNIPCVILLNKEDEFQRITGSVLIQPLRKTFREFININNEVDYLERENSMATAKTKDESKEMSKKSDIIWDMIKDLELNLFSLPNQFVKDYVDRIDVSEDELHFKFKSTAALPALEEALAGVNVNSKFPDHKLELEQAKDIFIIRAVRSI